MGSLLIEKNEFVTFDGERKGHVGVDETKGPFCLFFYHCGIFTFEIMLTFKAAFSMPKVKEYHAIVSLLHSALVKATATQRLKMGHRSEMDIAWVYESEIYTAL